MSEKLNKAKTALRFYLDREHGNWHYDNDSEVEELVDNIVAAAVEVAEVELAELRAELLGQIATLDDKIDYLARTVDSYHY